MYDLDFGSASYASVLDHVRDWGFQVNGDLVDNGDWTRDDLLDDLGSLDFSLMIFGTHGNPFSSTAPGYDGVGGAAVRSVISATTPARLPFFGYGDCRAGFSAVTDGMVDQVTRDGASGVLAGAGITWGFPAGSENYTEEVYNNFWRRALSGSPEQVGNVLRRAKADYSAGSYWSCRDKKGVTQMNLLGVPWTVIPAVGGSLAGQTATTTTAPATSGVTWSAPRRVEGTLADPTYVVSTTLDAPRWTITHPAAGLDLVDVDGFRTRLYDGVMLPEAEVTLVVPEEAAVEDVRVVLDETADLGSLRLASYVPGIDLYPGGRPEQWLATPENVGTVPDGAYTYEVRQGDGFQTIHVHVVPLEFDAAASKAVLHERIDVAVAYTAPTRLAVTDVRQDAVHHAPSSLAAFRASVVNVGDGPTTVTTTLRLRDGAGSGPPMAVGGPFELAPGASEIAPAFVVPADEGAYAAELSLWRNGVRVAHAHDTVQVVAQQIVALHSPRRVRPGGRAALELEVINEMPGSVSAHVDVRVEDPLGASVYASGPVPMDLKPGRNTVPMHGDVPASADGDYRVTVTLVPDGREPRRAVRSVLVGPTIYLPSATDWDSAEEVLGARMVRKVAGSE
jgi:hypothetical protein